MIYLINRINKKWLFNNIKYFYWINIFLLLLVLIFGKTINGSKSWFIFSFISFQPSEFMKVVLVLYLAVIINNKKDSELIRYIKCLFLVFIPTILTFIQPDTGIVISYIISFLFILFMSKIKPKWFIITTFTLISFISVLYLLIINNNRFIYNMFGDNLTYRMNRITMNDNFQLNNALIGIGSSNILPRLNQKYIIYIVESPTDFIFSTIATYGGFILSIILIINILLFDYEFIKVMKHSKKVKLSYLSGFIGLLLYQQIEHIFMNIGLLPITGITLPLVSYGGSSLLSFMIIIGLLDLD